MESLTKNGNGIKGNTVNHQNVTPLEQVSFNTTEVIMPGIVEPEGLLIRTRVLNAPAAGQVSVKVEASGICFARAVHAPWQVL